jgi:glyoxylase-like metal-dependent hydrolase (beta-lactamase superfamily II)/rhodanese-related sulfurtransferase
LRTRQLFDATSSTYTYFLTDEATRETLIIDPVFEQHTRDAALVRELGLAVLATLDTHCHADHVTGAWLMKQAFGCRIGMAAVYDAKNVDLPLQQGQLVRFGSHSLEVRATPGHTVGCLSFVAGNGKAVFSGDALLVRAAGRTDFQQGSAAQLYESITTQLFSLADDCVLYPGHDYEGRTTSTIGEERAFNPRIGGGARREDFVGYMNNMALPHPKLLAVAVPANLQAGQTENGAVPRTAGWGPVVLTYAGIPELSPEWLAQHRGEVQLIDVRSAAEFEGELGHLEGARLLPLDDLRARVGDLTDEPPIVAVCQTGKRSAMATVILRKAGLTRIANLSGGMARWRELGL